MQSTGNFEVKQNSAKPGDSSDVPRKRIIPRANASFTTARRDIVTNSDPEALTFQSSSAVRSRDNGADPTKFLSAQGKLHAALAGTTNPRAASFTAPSSKHNQGPSLPVPSVVVRQHTLHPTTKRPESLKLHPNERSFQPQGTYHQKRELGNPAAERRDVKPREPLKVRLEDLSDEVRRQRPRVSGVAVFTLICNTSLTDVLDPLAGKSRVERTVQVPVADLVAEQRERIRELEALLQNEKMRADTLLNLASRQIASNDTQPASSSTAPSTDRIDAQGRKDRRDRTNRLDHSDLSRCVNRIDRDDSGRRSDRNLFDGHGQMQSHGFTRRTPDDPLQEEFDYRAQEASNSNMSAHGSRSVLPAIRSDTPAGDSQRGKGNGAAQNRFNRNKPERAQKHQPRISPTAGEQEVIDGYSSPRTSPVSSTESDETHPSSLNSMEQLEHKRHVPRSYSSMKMPQDGKLPLDSNIDYKTAEDDGNDGFENDVIYELDGTPEDMPRSGSVRRVSSYHGPSSSKFTPDKYVPDPAVAEAPSRYHSYCADEPGSRSIIGRALAGRARASAKQQSDSRVRGKHPTPNIVPTSNATAQQKQPVKRTEAVGRRGDISGIWRKLGLSRRS